MPKVSSLHILRVICQRCQAYTRRLDGLRGRKSRIGRNQNILAQSWLERAIEAFEEFEADHAAEQKRTGQPTEPHEHSGSEPVSTGLESS